MKINEVWIKNQIIKDTLAVFRVGSDEKNYRILKMLPSSIDEIQGILKTKGVKSINTRVNNLEEVGLLIRVRGEGKVIPSAMTPGFLAIIDGLSNQVEKNIPKYLDDADLV